MPKSCNSISIIFSYVFVIIFISSCASVINDKNTSHFKGKVIINEKNSESLSFNINVSIYKNSSIIQIKRPFYGNVLKIELNQGEKASIFSTQYTNQFYLPDYIGQNLRYWLIQCLFSKDFNIFESTEDLTFKFLCNKNNDNTNIIIEYNEFYIEGFLIRQ
tara:strand:+ start:55 stop:537 length:483 start_codon:yes stop_codon:yes gene_type:complete